MSRIGRKPVAIPNGVTVKVAGKDVSVSGPKGNLSFTYPEVAKVAVDDSAKQVTVACVPGHNAMHGLTRALINNMVTGVSSGFERKLLIYGTGYNCKLQGKTLHLNIGYSGRRRGIGSQFELAVPDGIEVVIEKEAARGDTEPAVLVIKGVDKQKVGQFAAEIRSLQKTEPYKGKGIRYSDEHVQRKQGKALTSGG